MNLLSPAICETDRGEILIAWGGRRIVTRYLTPPLSEYSDDPEVERVYKRRYRWDSGPLVVTRIYDSGRKRKDYNAVSLGRNPAIIKDTTGRIWIGYRIPAITSQDPMGVNYDKNGGYVAIENAGTTAGMNMWEMARADDLTNFHGAFPWDWTEQVSIDRNPQSPSDGLIPDFSLLGIIQWIASLIGWQGQSEFGDDYSPAGWNMFTEWTEDRLSGELKLRGMGANTMDRENIRRWIWNEGEGLGREYQACIIDECGRQIRLAGNVISVSRKNTWPDNFDLLRNTQGSYGISGCLRRDRFGKIWVAGYNKDFPAIPYQIENEAGIRTRPPDADSAAEYEEAWAAENEKDWVIANANIPGEEYASYEEAPDPATEAAAVHRLADWYYALPNLADQRVAYCISRTGLHYIAWLHGNLTAVPVADDGAVKAVGLRIAVSRNDGLTFEPVIPERVGVLETS